MTTHFNPYITAEEAIELTKAGKMLILVDDEHRENEGDIIIPAQYVSPEIINFMSKECRGLICLSISNQIADKLSLPLMIENQNNKAKNATQFTVSIEAKEGVSSGISAYDRAHTILTAIKDDATAQDLVTPGHIFPLRAHNHGVLARQGHTEGSVDLAKLAQLKPASVICEIIKDNGHMARIPDLEIFAEKHQIKIITIKQLQDYRMATESIATQFSQANLPTKFGNFNVLGFKNIVNDTEIVALIKGNIQEMSNPLVRLHSQCLTGDVFGSLRCDCQEQLHKSIQKIEKQQEGIVLYLFQEGRGIGILNKIKAYGLQDQGYDTLDANLHLGFQADSRDYSFAANILKSLGIEKVRLMTNNINKVNSLNKFFNNKVERIPLEVEIQEHNKNYLKVKKERMGHLLSKI